MPVLSASVRCEEVPSAIDTTLLEEVLNGTREEQEHLSDERKELTVPVEGNPPVIFGWDNVGLFVEAIQEAQAQAASPGGLPLPPCPLALPAAGVNVHNFMKAVLEYARIPGAPPPVENICLPCSRAQIGEVTALLRKLDLEPWIQRIIAVAVPDSLPIAHIYVLRPRSDTLNRVMPQRPNSLWA